MTAGRPLRVAILDDYEIVVKGLARMFEAFPDRVEVVADTTPRQPVDIVLHDSFSRTGALADQVQQALRRSRADRAVVFSWTLDPELVEQALDGGASGCLGKALTAAALVEALERVHAGEVVKPEPEAESESGDWPGRRQGLTTRESEVIALITEGLSNQQIADRAFLSINSVKSYIRSSYRKMGVSSRSRAVLWGIENGFRTGRVRVAPGNGDGA